MAYFDVREGKRVLISQSMDMREPVVGFVTRVWDTGIDAIGFPNGKWVYYSGIWHCDDERWNTITPEERSVRQERGVFRVCDYSDEDVEALQRMVDDLITGIEGLKKSVHEYTARLDVVERALFGVEEEAG